MKSRRYFLIQGSLATTAMFALNPLKSIARTASAFTWISGNSCKLILLHTAHPHAFNDYMVIQYIRDIRINNAHAILLDAGQTTRDESATLIYDASVNGVHDLSTITGDYKIITKGNIKTGLISAKPEDSDVIQKINSLSAYLKKEKKCAIVVCLSQLGYKNKNTPDDITLANKSTHLDIIIGGHHENFKAQPIIALNSNNGEVIIHSAAGDPFACGSIGIEFDGQGRKKYISFASQS